MEDAAVLIDRLFEADLVLQDVEQFAVAETFRTCGVRIGLIDAELEHYCQKWSKRYMRRKLRERVEGSAGIPFSKTRVRFFKFSRLWRLALRDARRSALDRLRIFGPPG
jgi:hypothetical protein